MEGGRRGCYGHLEEPCKVYFTFLSCIRILMTLRQFPDARESFVLSRLGTTYHRANFNYSDWYFCFNIFVRYIVSLVPRPFLPPAFDHLEYAKMEKEELGYFIMCDDVWQTEGRYVHREGGGCLVKNLEAFLHKMAIQGSVKTACYSIHSRPINTIIMIGHSPSMCLPSLHLTSLPKAFPCIPMLATIKYRRWQE